jgi:hypothetical protein
MYREKEELVPIPARDSGSYRKGYVAATLHGDKERPQ